MLPYCSQRPHPNFIEDWDGGIFLKFLCIHSSALNTWLNRKEKSPVVRGPAGLEGEGHRVTCAVYRVSWVATAVTEHQ